MPTGLSTGHRRREGAAARRLRIAGRVLVILALVAGVLEVVVGSRTVWTEGVIAGAIGLPALFLAASAFYVARLIQDRR